MRGVSGVVIGLVQSVDDPNGLGRVRLTFPRMGENVKSAWAPISAAKAGKDRGSWWMPELGDEALVAFEHGDFDHPFVVGFLWNGSDQPPENDPALRVVRTPGGHELRFEDKAGSKKVIVQSDGGLRVTLDDTQQSIRLEGGGRVITMQSGQVRIT